MKKTTQELVHEKTYLANLPTFNQWISTPRPGNIRLGQHLINTAPDHIRRFAVGKAELDPFFVMSEKHHYYIENFIKFAELVWDVLDEDEMRTAYQMVLSEPGARR